jgi:hypothetical protein
MLSLFWMPIILTFIRVNKLKIRWELKNSLVEELSTKKDSPKLDDYNVVKLCGDRMFSQCIRSQEDL